MQCSKCGYLIDPSESSCRRCSVQEKAVHGGEIAYFGLSDWWFKTFSQEERFALHKDVVTNYLADNGITELCVNQLAEGRITRQQVSKNAQSLLLNLASRFNRPNHRHLSKRFIVKAEEVSRKEADYPTLYFVYSKMIDIYYSERNNETGSLEAAIEACMAQIAISTYALKEKALQGSLHRGFKQLAIIYEKQGNYQEAIRLCEQARDQGWMGDWDTRIAKLQKKIK